jgi:HEAT repeat protein
MTPLPVHAFHGIGQAALLFFFVCGISFLDHFRDLFFTIDRITRLKAAHDVEGLIHLLDHHDPDIQYHAVEALGEIADAGAVDPLITVLEHDKMSGVRWKTAESLIKIGAPSVEPLIRSLRHPDSDVRWKAAIALGEIKDSRAIEPLIVQLSDTDRFVKSRVAHALGMIGGPAVQSLIRALRDGDGNQRWGAAIALGGIKDARAVEPLILALADKYENVRAEAAASLGAIGRPAIEPLIRFLKYSKGTGRIEVMDALGALRASEAIEPLIQILEKADEQERLTINETLDAILTPSIERVTKRLSDDKSMYQTQDMQNTPDE